MAMMTNLSSSSVVAVLLLLLSSVGCSSALKVKRLRRTAVKIENLFEPQENDRSLFASSSFGQQSVEEESTVAFLERILAVDDGVSFSLSLQTSAPTASEPIGTTEPTKAPVPTKAPDQDLTTSSPKPQPDTSIPPPTVTDTPTVEPSQSTAPSSSEPPTPPTVVEQGREEQILAKCSMDMATRSTAITDILSNVSDPLDFLITSPQNQAREWLDEIDDSILCPNEDSAIFQRYIAALLYYAMSGPEWNSCKAALERDDTSNCNGTRWLSSDNECEWFGLTCNRDSTLTKIELSDNNLGGELFSELFRLSALEGITMDHNQDITGTIPPGLANLQKLQFINMDDNTLYGSIPEELYSITTLQAIDLNDNQLTGPITDSIGNLSKLVVLQLHNNLLNGPVPSMGLLQLQDLGTSLLHYNTFVLNYVHGFSLIISLSVHSPGQSGGKRLYWIARTRLCFSFRATRRESWLLAVLFIRLRQ